MIWSTRVTWASCPSTLRNRSISGLTQPWAGGRCRADGTVVLYQQVVLPFRLPLRHIAFAAAEYRQAGDSLLQIAGVG